MKNKIEIGAVFQRNDYHKDSSVPNYYVIITHIDNRYINARRVLLNNSLVHESISWNREEFLLFFRGIE